MTINTPAGPAPEPGPRPPAPVTESVLERLGEVVERLYNLHGATKLPLRPEMHLAGIVPALPEMARSLRRLYVELAGDDPWADSPEEPL